MSYDVYVNCHTCGSCLVRQENANAGCAGLWEAAGAVVKDWGGKTAHEVLPSLVNAIASMKDKPEYYQRINSNMYYATVSFLEGLRDACCRDPFATLSVSH